MSKRIMTQRHHKRGKCMSLAKIQNELKAPKNQFNAFGKYNYRNCEDILEALKPILLRYNATLIIADDVVLIGDRYYIKASVTLEIGDRVYSNSAYARESFDKKGMDDSQITGAASSYARKYALNGMFLIDDTKDADFMDNNEKQSKAKQPKQVDEKPWYNDFEKHKDRMIDKIGDGESVDMIIESLKEKYKLSKETEAKIRGL